MVNTAFFISPAYELPPIKTILREKSRAITVSLRTAWRSRSALKLGQQRIVSSGTNFDRSPRSGRISKVRIKRECQAFSVKTRVRIP